MKKKKKENYHVSNTEEKRKSILYLIQENVGILQHF